MVTIDYPTKITFSIQDFDGNDIYNVFTMVEIYDSITGKRVYAFPWTFRDVGDFNLYYQFPKNRGYQIVLSVANRIKEPSSYYSSIVEPLRSILNDVSDCDYTRTGQSQVVLYSTSPNIESPELTISHSYKEDNSE